MITPKTAEMMRMMTDGKWWRVTRDPYGRWNGLGVSSSVAGRLVGLGLADKDVQHSVDRHSPRITFIRLNKTGLTIASQPISGEES